MLTGLLKSLPGFSLSLANITLGEVKIVDINQNGS